MNQYSKTIPYIKSLTYLVKIRKLWASTILGIILPVLFLSAYTHTFAATNNVSSIGIANYIPINSPHVEDGDIVSAGSNGYILSATPYDPSIFGVVTAHPAIMIKSSSSNSGYPVINVGTVFIRVAGLNGNIKKGDMVTTSSFAGVGMKATTSGYVVGEALQDISFANKNDVKEIAVSLNLHYLQSDFQSTTSITELFHLSENAADQQPVRVFQYLMAGLIITLSFVFGFLIFVRFINTGIQALGRNPLASRTIQLSILMNVCLVIVILVSGVTLAYFMLRL